MRYLIFILLISSSNCFGGWSAARSITIDHTKIGGSDLSNYVFTLCANGAASTNCDTVHSNLDIPNLKLTPTGFVTSSSGFDIRPFSDNLCTTAITTYQTITYNGTSGFFEMKILIGSVSHTVDTLVGYLCYGNSAITTDGSSTTTWPSAYKVAWQFPDGTTLSVLDSTSNARTITNAVGPMVALAGGVYDGGAIGGTQNNNTASDTNLPSGTSNRTVSTWYKPHFIPNTGFGAIIYFGTAATHQLQRFYTSAALVLTANGGGGDDISYVLPSLSTTDWMHFAYTFDGTNAEIWVNGVSVAGPTAVAWNTVLTGTMWVTVTDPALATFQCQCDIDDTRITNTKRVDLLAEYNNGFSPSTFFTFGPEIPFANSSGAAKRIIVFN